MSNESITFKYGLAVFTRKTKFEDLQKSANPIIIWQFQQFDKDGNGKLDKKEFKFYEKLVNTYKQILSKKTATDNQNTAVEPTDKSPEIKIQEKKIADIENKFEKFQQKFAEYNSTEADFNQLCEMEHEYGIEYSGLNDGEELPEGTLEEDVEWRGMGKTDKNKENFTGDIYKKGYIKFHKEISDDVKNKYLELLSNVKKQAIEVQELSQDYEKLYEEYKQEVAIKDLLQNGIIKEVKTDEDKKSALALYNQIRDISNPFYQLYKDAEKRYTELARKTSLTKDEKELLTRYYSEMVQYQEVNNNWSVANAKESNSGINQDSYINLAGEKVTFTLDREQKKVSSSTGANFSSKFGNFTGNGGLIITNTAILTQELKLENTIHAEGGITYDSQNGYGGSLAISRDKSPQSTVTSYKTSASLKGLGIDVNHTVIKSETEDSEETENQEEATLDEDTDENAKEDTQKTGSVKNTNINISIPLGNFNNTAGIRIAPEGTTYQYKMQGDNLHIIQKTQFRWNSSGSLGYEFNNTTLQNTINSNIGTEFQFGEQQNEGEPSINWSGSLRGEYNLSSTMKHGSSPLQNSTLTIGGNIQKQDFNFGVNVSNTRNQTEKAWTFGANLTCGSVDNIGALTFEGSLSDKKTAEGEKEKRITASVKYAVSLDGISHILGKKKRVKNFAEITPSVVEQTINDFSKWQKLNEIIKMLNPIFEESTSDEIKELAQKILETEDSTIIDFVNKNLNESILLNNTTRNNSTKSKEELKIQLEKLLVEKKINVDFAWKQNEQK